MPDGDFTPIADHAIEFLKDFCGDGSWCLTAIIPDGATETVTFGPGEGGRCERWIKSHQGERNLYFTVNAVVGAPTKKPTKADIARMRALHVDVDVNGSDAVAARAAILEKLRAFEPAPSVIIDSGGGYQGFWRLRESHQVTPENLAQLEAYNRGLSKALGGDHCHNIDRLMRLPGTVNLPNAKKRGAGRVPVPAGVIEAHWDRTYALGDFTPDDGAEIAHRGREGTRRRTNDGGTRVIDRSAAALRIAIQTRRSGGSYEDFCEVVRTNPVTADWYVEKGLKTEERELKRAWAAAEERIAEGVCLDDFEAHMPTHKYMYAPSGDLWPGKSVNARVAPIPVLEEDGSPKTDDKGKPITVAAATWLDHNRAVVQMSWVPGEGRIIEGRISSHAGWTEQPGVRVFNLYRAPALALGEARKAVPWLRHLRLVYPDDHRHLLGFLAHRVQRPGEKINHAIVLGGAQGIGKDTLLEPVKQAVGPWNWNEISPTDFAEPYTGFAKSVILRINEAHDLGDGNRFQFYERVKIYTAAPPDALRVNDKYVPAYYVPNVCGVIVTTNHKINGVYLPADDRRHYVAWSNLTKEGFEPDYWAEMWGWYQAGGFGHVAAYLAELDISDFDPKAPPPKTDAWWAIVDAGRPSEDGDLGDIIIEKLRNPDAFVLDDLVKAASGGISDWLLDRRNRRVIPHRLEAVGYVPVRNRDDARDGHWRIDGKRQACYARSTLTSREQIEAVRQRQRQRPGDE